MTLEAKIKVRCNEQTTENRQVEDEISAATDAEEICNAGGRIWKNYKHDPYDGKTCYTENLEAR